MIVKEIESGFVEEALDLNLVDLAVLGVDRQRRSVKISSSSIGMFGVVRGCGCGCKKLRRSKRVEWAKKVKVESSQVESAFTASSFLVELLLVTADVPHSILPALFLIFWLASVAKNEDSESANGSSR